MQQIALDQRRAEFGFQPGQLSSSPVAGFVASAASPAARNASRQRLSVAPGHAETARDGLEVFARNNAPRRSFVAETSAATPGDAAPDLRSLRVAWPCSTFSCLSI